MREAFDVVAHQFEGALAELTAHNEGIDYDFTPVGPTKFTAEIFVDGASRTGCKIWIGTAVGGNEVAYSESDVGSSRENSYNELLSVGQDEHEFVLSAMMGAMSGREGKGLKLDRLTPDAAAEYLWRRFVARLS